jgi:DNA replication protein DnaC
MRPAAGKAQPQNFVLIKRTVRQPTVATWNRLPSHNSVAPSGCLRWWSLRYLEALLACELEERERNTVARRIKDDFSKAPQVPTTKIHDLAQGGYIERAEPIILIGGCGTGKTHLLTGLCVAACRQKRRVCVATAAALVPVLAPKDERSPAQGSIVVLRSP